MKVVVKKLPGKGCVVDIMPSDTVLQLKHKVSNLMGIEVSQQKLLYNGKALADANPLSFYPDIKDGCRLHMLVIKKTEEGSSKGKAVQRKSGIYLLRHEISRVLRYYYTESDTDSIVNKLLKILQNKVDNLSYDDLERLATALLQDQENIA
ncbi:ubiquitin-like protein 4A [Nomia melanderi]|uniref:ubiquitin-like protein 4A n=1 Tax=Nomia melanderi TaxID=2448451 RepID=UPI00130421DB|nr:ubiquitin-like protein 4A [Nomia melanderi]